MHIRDRHINLLVGSALLALVPLGYVQFRWISEVSEAEQMRRKADLQAPLEQIAMTLDHDFGRLHNTLIAPNEGPDVPIVERMERWEQVRGELPVRQVLLLQFDTEWRAEAYDFKTRLMAPAEVPAWWKTLPNPRRTPVVSSPPAIIGPTLHPVGAERDEGAEAPAWWLAAVLDEQRMREEYLPQMLRRYLGETRLSEYAVRLVLTSNPDSVVYTLGDSDWDGAPDMEIAVPSQNSRKGPPTNKGGRKKKKKRDEQDGMTGERRDPSFDLWRLQLRHKQGTLEQVVGRTRRRNLIVSGITLLLLAGALGALAYAAKRARRLAMLQMEFTAGVSHELRTPLAVIVSAGDNLAGGIVRDASRVKEYGTLISEEGSRLSAMVDHVLRFSALASGQEVLEKMPLSLEDLIRPAREEMQHRCERQGCTLQVTIGEGLVMADADAMQVALRNLLENALRHGGDSNWIGLSAAVVNGYAEFHVEDSGPGIPSADVEHLFEPFYRGTDSRAQQRKGSGLGLALVRRIAEAHGGRVSAVNRMGGGACFTVRIPAMS